MHGMSTERATGALKYLAALFPRWKTTPEVNELWVELFMEHEPETVLAVVRAHKREWKYGSPCLKTVADKLTAAQRQQSAAARESCPPEPDVLVDPPGYTWQQYAQERIDAGGTFDPVHLDDLRTIAAGGESRREVVRRSQQLERAGRAAMTGCGVALMVAGPENAEREAARRANVARVRRLDS